VGSEMCIRDRDMSLLLNKDEEYICGDVNGDWQEVIDIADLVYLVDYMFNQGPEPPDLRAANMDGENGTLIDIADLVYLVDYMFVNGPEPICDL